MAHFYHIFSYIFKNKHVGAVKFHMDNEKNMRNLLVSKSQKVGKNVKAIEAPLTAAASVTFYPSRLEGVN